MAAERLSTALFRETRGTSFFRVLTGPNAAFHVDVIEALDRDLAERPDGIAREEAIALITAVLDEHPEFEFDEETATPDLPDTKAAAPRDKARILLDHLLKCRWLDEPPRRDWRRMVHLDAHAATVLAALRKVAWPDAAVFTDKLAGVCAMLADELELAERPWQAVENCLSNVREGLNELRAMQKSVQRFTRRQLEEETLRGNLAVVFDDFAEQMSHACYAALVRARLPLRLPEAVRRIDHRLAGDPAALAAMQTEVLRRHPALDAAAARAQVLAALDELVSLLERVLPMADEIDRRTADFTRRSLARFRYLQDVSGERRTEVKRLFAAANALLAGRRLSHHAAELPELPEFRLPAVKLPAGLDSLHRPPSRRPPATLEAFEDAADDGDRAAGMREMERALRESLSVQRANAFVRSLPGGKGERIASADLPLHGEAGFTDLISLLLHAESAESRYRLDAERVACEDQPPPLDHLDGCRVERFSIVKK